MASFGGITEPAADHVRLLYEQPVTDTIKYVATHCSDPSLTLSYFDKIIKTYFTVNDSAEIATVFTGKWGADERDLPVDQLKLLYNKRLNFHDSFPALCSYYPDSDNVLNISWTELIHDDPFILISKLSEFTNLPIERFSLIALITWRILTLQNIRPLAYIADEVFITMLYVTKYFMNLIDLHSFSHGQIISKLWLCEEIETYMPLGSSIHISGGWYNVLGFMLSVRKPGYYSKITNTDIDAEAIDIADQICKTWIIGHDRTIYNQVGDCNTGNYSDAGVVINCSVEHFENDDWYDSIIPGTLVCIQSSDSVDPTYPWLVTQPCVDIESFLKKFPVTTTLFSGTKRIQYLHTGYNRFMLIGYK